MVEKNISSENSRKENYKFQQKITCLEKSMHLTINPMPFSLSLSLSLHYLSLSLPLFYSESISRTSSFSFFLARCYRVRIEFSPDNLHSQNRHKWNLYRQTCLPVSRNNKGTYSRDTGACIKLALSARP